MFFLLGFVCINLLKQFSQFFFAHNSISKKCHKLFPGNLTIICKTY